MNHVQITEGKLIVLQRRRTMNFVLLLFTGLVELAVAIFITLTINWANPEINKLLGAAGLGLLGLLFTIFAPASLRVSVYVFDRPANRILKNNRPLAALTDISEVRHQRRPTEQGGDIVKTNLILTSGKRITLDGSFGGLATARQIAQYAAVPLTNK